MTQIILYDVHDSYSSQSWNPNIWRVRFILNYKQLQYKTSWIEFPDVETTLRGIGAPPKSIRPTGEPVYALPVLVDPTRNQNNPIIVSTAHFIAEYLESAYPIHPVFPIGSRALQTLFVHYIQEVLAKSLLPILVPLSHQQLNHRSQIHFRHSPTLSSGYTNMTNSLLSNQPLPTGPRRERVWQLAKEHFDFLDKILQKNSADGDGIVAMGRDLTYADFALCSILIWIKQIAPGDGWSRVRLWHDRRWELLWERCAMYMNIH